MIPPDDAVCTGGESTWLKFQPMPAPRTDSPDVPPFAGVDPLRLRRNEGKYT